MRITFTSSLSYLGQLENRKKITNELVDLVKTSQVSSWLVLSCCASATKTWSESFYPESTEGPTVSSLTTRAQFLGSRSKSYSLTRTAAGEPDGQSANDQQTLCCHYRGQLPGRVTGVGVGVCVCVCEMVMVGYEIIFACNTLLVLKT